MNTFEIILLVAEIIVFNMITTPLMSKFAYKQALAKNKEWVKNNAPFLEKFPEPNANLSLALGIALLIVLAGGFYLDKPWIVKMVSVISMWCFLGQALIIDLFRSHQMKKQIPSPTARQASMASRHLSTFIPKSVTAFFTVCYVALAALAAYQYATGLIRKIDFLLITTPLVLVVVVGLPVLMWAIKRKPIIASEHVAQLYRKSEVFVTSLVLFTFLCISIGQALVANYPGHVAFKQTAQSLYYMCSILPMGFFIWFCTNKDFKSIIHEQL